MVWAGKWSRRIRLDTRRKFCTVRAVKQWNRLLGGWQKTLPGEAQGQPGCGPGSLLQPELCLLPPGGAQDELWGSLPAHCHLGLKGPQR